MKREQAYRKQYKLSLFQLSYGLPNLVLLLMSALISSSLIVWLDVIDRIVSVVGIVLVIAVSKKLTKNLKYEYNYGVEKIEALASLLCCAFEIFSVGIVLILSVISIFSPSEPSSLLLVPILVKALNLALYAVFFAKQKKLHINTETKVIESEYMTAKKEFLFSFVTFVSIFICWIFRNIYAMWYFSPIICCVIAVYLIIHSCKNIAIAISELTDKTLPEKEQMIILKCLSEFYSEYEELVSVNSLSRGNKNYIELHLKFASDMTYKQIEDFKVRFSERLKEKMDNGKVKIVI